MYCKPQTHLKEYIKALLCCGMGHLSDQVVKQYVCETQLKLKSYFTESIPFSNLSSKDANETADFMSVSASIDVSRNHCISSFQVQYSGCIGVLNSPQSSQSFYLPFYWFYFSSFWMSNYLSHKTSLLGEQIVYFHERTVSGFENAVT